MGQAARKIEHYITEEEHEQIELETGIKHEWYDGEVFAMAGATPVHNTLAGNVYASLHRQLRGGSCQAWGSDQQIKIPERRSMPYPDISVGCEPHEWDERRPNALTNPRVLVEVLSPATAEHDRTTKFDLYKSIPSFTDYVLVWSDRRRVEHFARGDDGKWTQSVAARDNECVDIASINCRLCLDDVYERTNLPASLDLSLLLDDDEDAPST